ncbi:MAG TPA: HEAT repeat domain-containing protein [Planctomycetaceae bacterium]|nr:HEAT repeat domain-containing protein [Planctomycetaceae bacterium]
MRGLTLIFALTVMLWHSAAGIADERPSCADLIAKLSDRSPSARGEAASQLGELGPEAKSAVPRLIELLNDETRYTFAFPMGDLRVASAASDALANIGAESVEHLGNALEKSSAVVRKYAVRSLQKIGTDASTALPQLMRTANDPDPAVRSAVVAALGAIDRQGDVCVPLLCELIRDTDTGVRRQALQSLGCFPATARTTVPEILSVLKDADSLVRLYAVTALACFPEEAETIVPAIIPLLDDDAPVVRGSTASALAKLGRMPKIAVPALLKSLQDRGTYSHCVGCICSQRHVSADALSALASFPSEAARSFPLVMAEFERNPWGDLFENRALTVQRLAPNAGSTAKRLALLLETTKESRAKFIVLRLLGDLRAKAAIPAVRKLLDAGPSEDDPDAKLALAAACALVRIDQRGNPDAWKRVLQALDDQPDGDVIAAIAAAGPDAKIAVPRLCELLEDNDVGLENSIIECLGDIGPSAAEAVPLILSQSIWPFDKDATIAALRKIGPDAIPLLVKTIDQNDPNAERANCASALGSFGKQARAAVPSLVTLCMTDDANAAVSAVQALSEIRSAPDRSLPALRQALAHDRVAVRAAAALALTSFPDGAAEGVPLITTALDDEYIVVRRAAAQSLAKFGKSAASSRPSLERIAKDDPSPLVRTAAREALAAIDGAAKR